MKIEFKHKTGFFCVVCCICLLLSCSLNQEDVSPNEITLVSWNLQTFFDSKTVGTEYDEFKGSKSEWTEEKYKSRLKLLCKFIEETNADIYAFCEIENESILQDISNNLNAKSVKGSPWQFAAFAKNESGAFGNAVLSKFPLENLRVHNIDFSISKPNGKSIYKKLEQPQLRPLLQIDVRTTEKKFSLFVCHWKSKSGGEAATKIWRDYQENMLSYQVQECKTEEMPFIICGDFNKDFAEFKSQNDFTILVGDENDINVYSAWNNSTELGTYYFRGIWSKIDNVFYSETIKLLDFKTLQYDYLLTQNGYPKKYDIHQNTGASDHLPVFFRCRLE